MWIPYVHVESSRSTPNEGYRFAEALANILSNIPFLVRVLLSEEEDQRTRFVSVVRDRHGFRRLIYPLTLPLLSYILLCGVMVKGWSSCKVNTNACRRGVMKSMPTSRQSSVTAVLACFANKVRVAFTLYNLQSMWDVSRRSAIHFTAASSFRRSNAGC